jgi:hypothetical protein
MHEIEGRREYSNSVRAQIIQEFPNVSEKLFPVIYAQYDTRRISI